MIGIKSGPKVHVARIGLADAENLSDIASICARSNNEAKNRPGSFNRPNVGRNPDYFANAAHQVLRTAIKENDELGRLYERGERLAYNLNRFFYTPWMSVKGPDPEVGTQLALVSGEIRERIDELDLRVELSGKWLGRAQEISRFALRMITRESTNDHPGAGFADMYVEENVTGADYWKGLQQQLWPEGSEI